MDALQRVESPPMKDVTSAIPFANWRQNGQTSYGNTTEIDTHFTERYGFWASWVNTRPRTHAKHSTNNSQRVQAQLDELRAPCVCNTSCGPSAGLFRGIVNEDVFWVIWATMRSARHNGIVQRNRCSCHGGVGRAYNKVPESIQHFLYRAHLSDRRALISFKGHSVYTSWRTTGHFRPTN